MKTIFLYQGPHLVHKEWSKSINALPIYYNLSPLFQKNIYIRWLKKKISELFFLIYPNVNVDAVLCEGGAVLPQAMVFKHRFNSKIILLAADPMFYNLSVNKKIQKMLNNIDGIIAVSKMVKEDTMKYLSKNVPTEIVEPYIDHYKFSDLTPDFSNNNLIFIGAHLPIKGINILPKIFQYIQKKVNNVNLFILGKHTQYTRWLKLYSSDNFQIIDYSRSSIVERYLEKSSLLIHPAFYDPVPVAVLEAMAAGVIPIITDSIGAKEIVKIVSNNLITKPNSKMIAEKVIETLNLPYEEKINLSKKCKKEALKYTKDFSVKKFRDTYLRLVET